MTLNEYQEAASKTRLPTADDVYCALNLAAEAGEVLSHYAKYRRDGTYMPDVIVKELGDVLWHIAALAEDLGYDLDDVATLNLDKLASRKARGVLSGSGDNR